MALQVTNNNDWGDMQGKPYLQASGAEKVARLFGISWTINPPDIHVDEEGHSTFTYSGQFSFQGATIEAIGMRSTKDKCFRQRTSRFRG